MTAEQPLIKRHGPAYPWLVAITVLSAFSTAVMTSSIVNVAVPNVMGTFGVGQDQVQFIATSFFATMTASLLISPWAVGRFGPRLTFSFSLLFFAFGALVCTFCPNLPSLIFGRVMQGFASGIMQPVVMVALVQAFPSDRRGLAMGLFSMGIVCAHGVGPYFGGLTIDHFNWRLIFLVPLPIVAFAFVMGLTFLPKQTNDPEKTPFDLTGFILLCISLFFLMTSIANGQRDGWHSNTIILQFCIAGIAGFGFIVSQIFGDRRILALDLFQNKTFMLANVVAFIYGLVNFSGVYLYPVFGQLVQEHTPTTAGFLVLPGAIAAVMILPLTGRFADIAPPQTGIAVGICLFACSNLFLASADIGTMLHTTVVLILIGRIGLAFLTPPMMSIALGSLPPDKLNEGSAIVNFTMLGSGAIGINALVAFLDMRTQFHSEALVATQTSANPTTQELLFNVKRLLNTEGFPAALQPSVALNYLSEMVHSQANTLGFQDGFVAIATVTLFGLLPAMIIHVISRRN